MAISDYDPWETSSFNRHTYATYSTSSSPAYSNQWATSYSWETLNNNLQPLEETELPDWDT